MFIRLLAAAALWVSLSGMSSCSTEVNKLYIDYKADLSGDVRALVSLDSKRTEELEKLKKAIDVCGVSLKEVAQNSSSPEKLKFIAEYKFESYNRLMRATECSEDLEKKIEFHASIVKDNLFSRDTTLSMSINAINAGSRLTVGSMPEIVISTPGKIVSASITPNQYFAEKLYDITSTVTGNDTIANFIFNPITEDESTAKLFDQAIQANKTLPINDLRKSNFYWVGQLSVFTDSALVFGSAEDLTEDQAEYLEALGKIAIDSDVMKSECDNLAGSGTAESKAKKVDACMQPKVLKACPRWAVVQDKNMPQKCDFVRLGVKEFYMNYTKTHPGSCPIETQTLAAMRHCIDGELERNYPGYKSKKLFTLRVTFRVNKLSKYFP